MTEVIEDGRFKELKKSTGKPPENRRVVHEETILTHESQDGAFRAAVKDKENEWHTILEV